MGGRRRQGTEGLSRGGVEDEKKKRRTRSRERRKKKRLRTETVADPDIRLVGQIMWQNHTFRCGV